MGQIETTAEGQALRVLLLEDDDADAELVLAELDSAGVNVNVTRAKSRPQLRAAVAELDRFDAVLCDYNLPDIDALGALEMLQAAGVLAPLIVVSGGLNDERATECMRMGAVDYILKDRLQRLPHALLRAVEHARLQSAGEELERSCRRLFENLPVAVFRASPDGRFLDANPAMVSMFGYPDRATLLATPVADLHVDPSDREALLEELHDLGHVLDFTCRMRRADGSEFWFSRDVQGVREQGGKVVEMESIGRDVTERREALGKVQESEAYLSTVIETAPDAVVRMDESGVITDWNSAAESTFGWTREEAIGRRLSETIIPPGFRDRHEAGLRRFKADGSSTLIGRRWDSFEGMRKNGETFPIELAISPPIKHGAAVQFVGFARDISERRQAERDLEQSVEVFRSLFEQSAVGISLFELHPDAAAAPLRWNPRMRDMLGVEVDPVDLSWLAAATGDEAQVTEAQYARLLAGELDQLRERRKLNRADGTTVWGDLSTVLVRDVEGAPLRFQTMALDITEQVAAEQRLSMRVAQQAVLLELSSAGLEEGEISDFLAMAAELVARGTETQFATILEVRQADQRFDRIAAYGQFRDLPLYTVPAAASRLGLEAMKAKLRVPMSFDYAPGPGPERNPWMIECGVVATVAVGLYAPTRPFGVIAAHSTVARQFTQGDLQFMQLASAIISVAVERKQGEKQRRMLLSRLVTAQEAERKTIAEDIHDDAVQVMTAANMRLELFRMTLTDPVQVAAAEKLQETVSLATGRLRNLLFELSPPDLERHGLVAAIRRYHEQFQHDAAVHCDLDSRLDAEPSSDVRILLFRIFQEAMVNVRKHAAASAVTVTLKSMDGGVMLRVADDGKGFNEAAAESRAGHLGLASMRERAEIAGGWWRISSEPGHGTQVSTWVPTRAGEDVQAFQDTRVMAIG